VYPNQVTHYSGLANAYANIGQIQKAKAVANEAVKKDPAQKKEIDEFLKLLNEKEQQQE
jgi:hypothetical protein